MPLPYINASNFYRAGGITLYRQTISPEVNAILFSVDRMQFRNKSQTDFCNQFHFYIVYL